MTATPQPISRLPHAEHARSRSAADRDARYSSVMNGLTDPFMIPYALALGADAFQAGLLSSVRNLLLAVVQLGSGAALRALGSRKALVLWTAGLQAALWLPLVLVRPLFGAWAVAALIVAYTLGTAAAALGGPAWGSLIADYVGPEERGRYFGRRAWLVGFYGTAAGLAAGGVLQLARHHVLFGFGALCAGACLARLLSWRALREMHDAGWHEETHLQASFLSFLRAAPRSNYTRFSLCLAASSFATNIASPFFAVYMLQQLKLSYVEYTLVILAGSVTGMLCSPWWGRVGDRFGNHAVLRWNLVGVAVLPVMWQIVPSAAWMLALNVLGAFLWSGINLAATNFIYDAVERPQRHTCMAHFNVLNGVGVSAGAFVGATIIAAMGPFGGGAAFFVAFLVSALARLASWIAFERLVSEVREVRQIGLREVMLDLLGQCVVAVLGYFSVRPEQERRRDGRPPE